MRLIQLLRAAFGVVSRAGLTRAASARCIPAQPAEPLAQAARPFRSSRAKNDSGYRRLKEYYLYFRQACQSHLADYASPGYRLNQPACSAPQAGKYSEDATIAKGASTAVSIVAEITVADII